MTDRVTGWLAALAGAGALLAAMTALGAPSAQAQGVEAPQEARVIPPAFAPTEAAGSFDRETLDAFARATRIVGALRNEYMPKIAAANIAGRPDRAEALFDEMRARMHDAIDATGLTIERYEAIAARAEHDRALRARIEAIMTGARPPADPGLGVEAPQSAPRTPVTQTEDTTENKLAAAQDEIERLHRRLDAERTRARADRETAASEAAALRSSLEGAIEKLAREVSAATTADETIDATADLEALRMANARDALARAALLREVARLGHAFAAAQEALEALGADLSETPAPDVVPLARLETRPLLIGGSVPNLARDLTAVQSRDALRARLEAEQTRNIALRARHASERVSLRREIDRIGRTLASATAMLDTLAGGFAAEPDIVAEAPAVEELATRAVARAAAARDLFVSDPMHDREIYAVSKLPDELAMPVTAAPMRVPGTLDAGIHAYESRDYARAYRIWRPLAENGEANAQFHLGALYFEGRGVDRNLAEARRWLRAALAQGQERARFLLGRVEDGIAKAG